VKTDFTAHMNELCSASSDKIYSLTFFSRGRYGGGQRPLSPPFGSEEKSSADVAYDCRGISGPMSTIALAVANSSLQVNKTVVIV